MIGVNAAAQVAAPAPTGGASIVRPPTGGGGKHTQSTKGAENDSAVLHNPACQNIIGECKKLGFIVGQWKQDNGLWKDCFDPIVTGKGSPTRDGKPITVPVTPGDVQACHASVHFKTESDSTPKPHRSGQ